MADLGSPSVGISNATTNFLPMASYAPSVAGSAFGNVSVAIRNPQIHTKLSASVYFLAGTIRAITVVDPNVPDAGQVWPRGNAVLIQ